jgi:hypothetical protein
MMQHYAPSLHAATDLMVVVSPSCEFVFLAARARSKQIAAHALSTTRLCGIENSHSLPMLKAVISMRSLGPIPSLGRTQRIPRTLPK